MFWGYFGERLEGGATGGIIGDILESYQKDSSHGQKVSGYGQTFNYQLMTGANGSFILSSQDCS